MQEHKEKSVFHETVLLSTGFFLHVTITIIDVLVREVRS